MDKHVLIVEVPESDDAPHLVQPKRDGGNVGWFVAPYRSGPDTNNMVEKQLEGAYRQRLDGRRRQQLHLRELHEELGRRHVVGLDEGSGTVVAIAQPLQSATGPGPEGEPMRLAQGISTAATVLANQMAGELGRADRFAISLLSEATVPRRALRRFVFTAQRQITTRGGAPLGRPAYAAFELHDDGTFGLIWRRGAGYRFTREVDTTPPSPALGLDDMDIIAILLYATGLTVSDELALATDYQFKVSLSPHSPVHLIPGEGWSHDDPIVAPPSPALEASVRFGSGPDARAADLLALGLDLCNMVEQRFTALEGFWQLPRGSGTNHPLRVLAQRLFGGEPDHPTSGRPMA
jgi:hypothetical protein